MKDGARLDPRQISSLQLMLSKFEYDGALNPNFRAGPFALPISSINTYWAGQPAPRFVHVSSAGRGGGRGRGVGREGGGLGAGAAVGLVVHGWGGGKTPPSQ